MKSAYQELPKLPSQFTTWHTSQTLPTNTLKYCPKKKINNPMQINESSCTEIQWQDTDAFIRKAAFNAAGSIKPRDSSSPLHFYFSSIKKNGGE